MRAREWTVTGLTILQRGKGEATWSALCSPPQTRCSERNRHVTVGDELLDSLSRVGGRDLGGLSGVEPDWTAERRRRQSGRGVLAPGVVERPRRTLPGSNLGDGRSKALLDPEVGELGH